MQQNVTLRVRRSITLTHPKPVNEKVKFLSPDGFQHPHPEENPTDHAVFVNTNETNRS
jgi:hypothetical protein